MDQKPSQRGRGGVQAGQGDGLDGCSRRRGFGSATFGVHGRSPVLVHICGGDTVLRQPPHLLQNENAGENLWQRLFASCSLAMNRRRG